MQASTMISTTWRWSSSDRRSGSRATATEDLPGEGGQRLGVLVVGEEVAPRHERVAPELEAPATRLDLEYPDHHRVLTLVEDADELRGQPARPDVREHLAHEVLVGRLAVGFPRSLHRL